MICINIRVENSVANRFNIASHPWLRRFCTSTVRLVKIAATALFSLARLSKENGLASDERASHFIIARASALIGDGGSVILPPILTEYLWLYQIITVRN